MVNIIQWRREIKAISLVKLCLSIILSGHNLKIVIIYSFILFRVMPLVHSGNVEPEVGSFLNR